MIRGVDLELPKVYRTRMKIVKKASLWRIEKNTRFFKKLKK